MHARILAVLAACLAFAVFVACGGDGGGGCETDDDCKGDRICEAGSCVSPDTGGGDDGDDGSSEAGSGAGSEAGDGSGDTAAATDTSSQAPSCEESGTYCEDNILFDCTTDEVIVNCKTCKYVGPGTGSEYDTSCKAQMSDCSACEGDMPWDGAGCYFGGGPAVCKT